MIIVADTGGVLPALPSLLFTAGSWTERQAVKSPFFHQEPIQNPFGSFSEPPTLLWRPAAEQRQHKLVTLSPSRVENALSAWIY
jgi:hypothetical protein